MTTHPIARYIDEAGITQREFATRCGLSPQFVNDMIAGRYTPGVATAKTIVEKTGGSIRLDELLTWEPPAQRRRA